MLSPEYFASFIIDDDDDDDDDDAINPTQPILFSISQKNETKFQVPP